ncbi:MAG TPA: serine/threonine-protein kinase [Polyangiaceae bacterium]
MPTTQVTDPFGLVGSVIERQFRIDAVVGEGGFGVVYKGWHLALDQPIAIKALKMPETRDASMQGLLLQKFREEAKLTYVLSQATLNVVRTIDFGATTAPTGAWVPFAVLEWLEGETLAQELRRRRTQGRQGRTLAEAMALLEPAARALALAHQRRVAHRDVKPGNLFLMAPAAAANGVMVKLLDFGIAKVMREGATQGGATSTGIVSFTPGYAAPEQVEGRYGGTGPWTDVYGLALVLTELMTDRVPFDATDVPELLRQVLDPGVRPTPRSRGAFVPDAFEAVMARSLSVDPRARPRDAGEMWAALVAAAAVHAAPLPTPPPGSMQAAAASYLPQPASNGYAPGPAHPAAAPHAGRTANVVAAVLGVGLTLLLFVLLAAWSVTRR